MAAYKTLKGQSIKKVAQDPANPLIGQIWYNTTIGSLKVYKTVNGTWASGGARSTSRSLSGQAGTQTAGLSFGGYIGPAFTTVKNTEEYNGTSWTSGGDINSPAGLDSAAGSGSQAAALSASGKSGGPPSYTYPTITNSFEYDGSSWSGGGAVSNGRTVAGSAGTQTASLLFGGQSQSNKTEEYDGSSWTNGGNLPQGINRPGGTGTQTAAIQMGGHTDPPADFNVTNYYDGSSWTAQPGTMNTARNSLGSSGTQTNCVIYGGYKYSNPSGNSAATELWDGTSWTTTTSMATAGPTSQSPSGGDSSLALAVFGGTTVEEWTGPIVTTRNVTTTS